MRACMLLKSPLLVESVMASSPHDGQVRRPVLSLWERRKIERATRSEEEETGRGPRVTEAI